MWSLCLGRKSKELDCLNSTKISIQKWMMIYDNIEYEIIIAFYVENPLNSLANHISCIWLIDHWC